MLGFVEEYLGGGVQLSLDNRDRLVTSSRVPGTKSYFEVMFQVSPSSRLVDFSTLGEAGLHRRCSTSSFSSSSSSPIWNPGSSLVYKIIYMENLFLQNPNSGPHYRLLLEHTTSCIQLNVSRTLCAINSVKGAGVEM